MTDESSTPDGVEGLVEDTLRQRFAAFVAHIDSPPGLADMLEPLRRRRRSRQRVVVAAVAAAAALAVAVPTVGLRVVTSPSAHTRVTPVPGVRGSLSGDRTLLSAATTIAVSQIEHFAQTLPGPHGYPAGNKLVSLTVDPTSVRPYFAERVGDYELVAFYGFDSHHGFSFATSVIRKKSGPLVSLGVSGAVVEGDKATELAQKPYPEQFLAELLTGGRIAHPPFAMVVVPPGVTAQIAYRTEVTADLRVRHEYHPLRLHQGTALVTVPDNSVPWVRLSRGDTVLAEQSLGVATRTGNNQAPVVTPYTPSAAQLAKAQAQRRQVEAMVDAQLAQVRSVVDVRWLAESALGEARGDSRLAGTATTDPRLVWGGHLADGRQVIVVTSRFASGALHAWLAEEDRNSKQHSSDYTFRLVSPGSFQQHVFTFAYGNQYVVVGPPDGTRAEIRLANGHTSSISLDQGGGILELGHGQSAKAGARVRVFDNHGTLLDERSAEQGGVDDVILRFTPTS